MTSYNRICAVIIGMCIILTLMGDAAIAKAARVQMIPESFSSLAENAKPGVVNIRTVKLMKGGGRVFKHFFGQQGNPFEDNNQFQDFFERFFGDDLNKDYKDYKQRSLGSGFLLDSDGYIVTNNHVIEDADKIKVKLSEGTEYDAEVVGRDSKTDLALIKIPSIKGLKALPIGDSELLKVGEWVVAIGSPFGLEQTVTAGIVSAKGRIIGSGPYDDFIQTDASINPGNSGGPLLNMNGEVIGINTAIVAQGQGIGFAIPINMAKNIIDQLKNQGEVTRGWLGVGIQDITEDIAEYYNVDKEKGVLITEVFEGDPAEQAGIKAKDIIVAVDGKQVTSTRDLSLLIANTSVGKKTAIDIIRDGKRMTKYVTIAKRNDTESTFSSHTQQKSDYTLGLKIANLTPELAEKYGHKKGDKGVLVVDIQQGGKAEAASIQQGDLIKEVNRVSINSVDEFNNEVDDVKSGQTIHLFIKRSHSGFAVIKIEK